MDAPTPPHPRQQDLLPARGMTQAVLLRIESDALSLIYGQTTTLSSEDKDKLHLVVSLIGEIRI